MPKPFAIVTGGFSAQGREFARLLAKDGYDVLICSNCDQDLADENNLQKQPNIKSIDADLTTENGFQEFLGEVLKENRPIEIAILNTGVPLGPSFIDNSYDEQLRVLSVNFIAVIKVAQRIIPKIVNSGSGQILLSSSLSAATPTAYESMYGPSRTVLSYFGDYLRNMVKGTNVNVTILHPGLSPIELYSQAERYIPAYIPSMEH